MTAAQRGIVHQVSAACVKCQSFVEVSPCCSLKSPAKIVHEVQGASVRKRHGRVKEVELKGTVIFLRTEQKQRTTVQFIGAANSVSQRSGPRCSPGWTLWLQCT